jgi:acetyltransferase-like isoleucine patch superfamily enzyme
MKALFKKTLRALCLFLVFPLWVLYAALGALAGRTTVFYGFSQLMGLIPGITGNYLRHAFYHLSLARLGEDACICFCATISHPDTEIGSNAYIGPFSNLGLCLIGDDTLLGTGVHVMSGFGQHAYDRLDAPIRLQGGALAKVRVGGDCWIGNHSVVGADVGARSVVGAASLVNKPIPEFSVAVGNPARVIRDRRDGPDKADKS